MKKLALLAVTAAFSGLGVVTGFYTYPPSIEGVTVEQATLEPIPKWKVDNAAVVRLYTASGQQLRCGSTSAKNTSRCPGRVLATLSGTKKPLNVWHHGGQIYRIDHDGLNIFNDFESAKDYWRLQAAFMFLLCSAMWAAAFNSGASKDGSGSTSRH